MTFPEPIRRYGPRIAAGAVAAVGLATFAVLPSAAAPDFQAVFKKLDANGDGVLSPDEFAGPKDASDGQNVVVETRTRQVTRDGTAAPPPTVAGKPAEMKQEAFSFWLPDELGGAADQQHEYKIVSLREVRIEADDASDANGAVPTPPASPAVVSLEDIRKREFETFDNDRDGKVSYAEFLARQKAMLTKGFEMLDANGDKVLNQDEYAKIVSPPMPKLHADDPDIPDADVRGGPKVSPEAVKAAFINLDANRDNRLSLQEYLPPS